MPEPETNPKSQIRVFVWICGFISFFLLLFFLTIGNIDPLFYKGTFTELIFGLFAITFAYSLQCFLAETFPQIKKGAWILSFAITLGLFMYSIRTSDRNVEDLLKKNTAIVVPTSYITKGKKNGYEVSFIFKVNEKVYTSVIKMDDDEMDKLDRAQIKYSKEDPEINQVIFP